MCNYNVHVSSKRKKQFSTVFLYILNPHIYSVVCFFLPLKKGRVAFLTLGLFIEKKKGKKKNDSFLFFSVQAGIISLESMYVNVHVLPHVFFFFSDSLLEEISVNAQRTNIFNTTIATSTTGNTD